MELNIFSKYSQVLQFTISTINSSAPTYPRLKIGTILCVLGEGTTKCTCESVNCVPKVHSLKESLTEPGRVFWRCTPVLSV